MGRLGRELFSFGLLADTHVSEAEALTINADFISLSRRRSAHAVARLNALGPAFVVHLGDITHPNPGSSAYEASVGSLHRVLAASERPLHFVPGNHDIGEKSLPGLPSAQTDALMTEESIALYERHFSPQYSAMEHQACLFVFLNGQLHNSGLPAEEGQRIWFEDLLAANRGRRMFVFSHYPLFLTSPTERDHYDAIGEPARSWLLGLLRAFDVEAYFAGHVHNFFCNLDSSTHHYVLPSVCFLRHDYHELFRVEPGGYQGRHDLAKLGFGLVKVYEHGHVCHIVRTYGGVPDDSRTGMAIDDAVVHAYTPEVDHATVGLDLGVGWCDTAVIPTPWGLDAFHRKRVRNDYPLLALREMGIRPIRFLAIELIDETVAARVAMLADAGHLLTVASFGMPDEAIEKALSPLAPHIAALEVVAPVTKLAAMMRALGELKSRLQVRLIVNPFRAGVDAWSTCHGFSLDDAAAVRALMAHGDAGDIVSGVVFGVEWDRPPGDALAVARDIVAGLAVRPVLHVQMARRIRVASEDFAHISAARAAEAAALAVVAHDVDILLDNFTDIDRGYFFRHGLVDRLFNPQPVSHVIRRLHGLLGDGYDRAAPATWSGGRLIHLTGARGHALLVLPGRAMPIERLPANGIRLADPGKAEWIDPVEVSSEDVTVCRSSSDGHEITLSPTRPADGPVLLRLGHGPGI